MYPHYYVGVMEYDNSDESPPNSDDSSSSLGDSDGDLHSLLSSDSSFVSSDSDIDGGLWISTWCDACI